mgnify:CR=1 FL=1
MMRVSCYVCNKVIERYPSGIKERNYCSSKCWYKYHKEAIHYASRLIKCDECGKEFERNIKRIGGYKKNYCSKECYIIKNNPAWKGDNVGYYGLHNWVRKRKPKPAICENCKERKPRDLANISQQYKRDINDFEWLCRRCHIIKDGRLNRFEGNRKGKPSWNKGLPREMQPFYEKKHTMYSKLKMSKKQQERRRNEQKNKA